MGPVLLYRAWGMAHTFSASAACETMLAFLACCVDTDETARYRSPPALHQRLLDRGFRLLLLSMPFAVFQTFFFPFSLIVFELALRESLHELNR
jgi:hypothetical protein